MSEKKLSASARRDEERRRELAQRKKTTRIAVLISSAVLVLFVLGLIVNSNFMRRSVTAVTVGDVKITAAEYAYFYQEAVSEYQNLMYETHQSEYTSYLPDFNKTLSSQIYDYETMQTWQSFFYEQTEDLLRSILLAGKDAEKNGFTLSDDQREEMQSELEEIRQYISDYYSTTFNSFQEYLQNRYGSAMTEELFEELHEKRFTVSKYVQSISESFSYSEEEYNAYYDENKDDLDAFTYRSFSVDVSIPVQGDLTDEAFAPLRLEAVKEAEALSHAYMSSIQSASPLPQSTDTEPEPVENEEETVETAEPDPVDLTVLTTEERFITVASEYKPDSYADVDSTRTYRVRGENLSAQPKNWLLDSSRVYGDLTIIPDNEDEALITRFTIYLFVERSDNSIDTINVRQLYVSPVYVGTEDYLDDEGNIKQEDYDAAVAAATSTAQTIAEDLYDSWREAGYTEEALIKLTRENESDTVSGDRYDNIPLPAESDIEATGVDAMIGGWIYDRTRKAGDTTLIKTGDDIWVLLYFDGPGMKYRDAMADAVLRNDSTKEWTEQFNDAVVVEKWGFRFI